MVTRKHSHEFQCAVCSKGENSRLYCKGEFRHLEIVPPEDETEEENFPHIRNLCFKHHDVLVKFDGCDRWEEFVSLCRKEQDGDIEEYVHPVDEREEYELAQARQEEALAAAKDQPLPEVPIGKTLFLFGERDYQAGESKKNNRRRQTRLQ